MIENYELSRGAPRDNLFSRFFLICQRFNFDLYAKCRIQGQSRRHGGTLVGLVPQTMFQAPKLKRETL